MCQASKWWIRIKSRLWWTRRRTRGSKVSYWAHWGSRRPQGRPRLTLWGNIIPWRHRLTLWGNIISWRQSMGQGDLQTWRRWTIFMWRPWHKLVHWRLRLSMQWRLTHLHHHDVLLFCAREHAAGRRRYWYCLLLVLLL